MIRIGRAAALMTLAGPLFILGCAGGGSREDAPAADIRSVSVESLTPYKQVFLKVGPDTLENCDTASDYKRFVKVPAGKGKPYDAFSVNGEPVIAQTFLKVESDSVYFMATVRNKNKEDSYVSLCLERRYISETLTAEAPGSKREGHKGKGGPHGGRRRSGGGPFG